ncbi:MAG: hypothetical protein C3F13_09460 [Anaerolineales bacterium]|nr:hypothetical protein [Anaerolineae bacterium]PWB53360.1 MAG: hypothetical protein C3F13_09460 [Anaerolineales bacterium]
MQKAPIPREYYNFSNPWNLKRRAVDNHLSFPKTINEKTLDEWSRKMIKLGVPVSVLREHLSKQPDVRATEYDMRLLVKLPGIMAERNQKGKNFERKGKIDEAIKMYEANVTDRFNNNFPYDRLRIIYTNQQRYEDAIRVCHAFVDMANTLLNAGTPRGDVLPKRDRYMNYIERLEIAKNRSKPI